MRQVRFFPVRFLMLTQKRLKEVFNYNSKTGIFIRKISINPRFIDTESGHKTSQGYIEIYVDGKEYKAHRLAWLYMYGYWPKEEIDHIDHNRSNNAINNLREVSRKENCRNQKLRRNNTSGDVGVDYVKSKKKWRAKIAGKLVGLYVTKQEAVKARKNAECIYGFHPNHGKN